MCKFMKERDWSINIAPTAVPLTAHPHCGGNPQYGPSVKLFIYLLFIRLAINRAPHCGGDCFRGVLYSFRVRSI